MDFDEYEYLEKTVEEQQQDDGSSKKKRESGNEKSERSYRKREGERDEEDDGEERRSRRSKKSRGHDEENGAGRRDRDKDRHRSSRDKERDREKDRDDEREKDRDRERSSRDREKERDRKDRDKEKERDKETDREKKERERDGGKESERESRSSSRSRREERERYRERRSSSRSLREDKDRDRERSGSRSRREDRERERERSSSRSRREEREREREREREPEIRESRRYKDKKEAAEPEADPERDQRTVFAYQMPLKATERDVYEFFSKAGKVRDVRLIMDRNSRRSKGVGYIEFYDVMSVPMAIALSGQLLLGQPVMVKPSEAEKNLAQSNTSGGGVTGTGPVDRKLYVGNLHFNMTELQLRQIFEPFGPVELIQLPLDLETGQCKGFGFIQFAQLEHAKAAQSALNGKLEIAGRTIKVSSVTDHVGTQDKAPKSADFDDEDGGGLSLNAQSRAMLMQKLDRTGIATSIVGSLGIPALNGSGPNQQAMNLPISGQTAFPSQVLPATFIPNTPIEPIGQPSECLLLKNMFDPATESEPDFDIDIKEDVEEECSKYGRVIHSYVDKNSAGFVYLRFESVGAAAAAQRAMHMRWFARRCITALFMPPQEYEAKFRG